MFLPSTSHFLKLGKGREKGCKKEKKECWRGRREYYAFRDEYLASLIGHGITITELRIRLEAYTLSNAGDEVKILIIVKTTGWKPVPRPTAHCSLLITHCLCGTGFQPAVKSMIIIRRQMLTHFPTALKVLASSQNLRSHRGIGHGNTKCWLPARTLGQQEEKIATRNRH